MATQSQSASKAFALLQLLSAVIIATAHGALSVPLEFKPSEKVGLNEIDAKVLGLNFSGSKSRRSFKTTQYIDNAGLAIGDVNADGLPDIFFCGGDGPSKLYLNQGNWGFKETTAQAGLNLEGHYINAATFADGDNDGDLDLFLGSLYDKSLYFTNNGKGQFQRSDQVEWQESPTGGVTSLALADIDNDGDLDLYTTRYLNTVIADRLTTAEFQQLVQSELSKLKEGKPLGKRFAERYTLEPVLLNGKSSFNLIENGLNDLLYLNDGQGHFSPALKENSRFRNQEGQLIDLPQDWGLSCAFHDIDGDGDSDLYVCNDFESPDRFWINDGHGFFSPINEQAIGHSPLASTGIDVADINNDGFNDFVVLNKIDSGKKATTENTPSQYPKQALYLNRGDNTYAEVSFFAGINASEWAWAAHFVDLDLDGYQDLIVTRGATRDYTDEVVKKQLHQLEKERGPFSVEESLKNQSKYPPKPLTNLLFQNQGNLRFKEIANQWGFTASNASGGVVSADLDNDGDLDLIINNSDSPPNIYQNNSGAPRLSIRILGTQSNTQAIGAKLILTNGNFTQQHELSAGGIYASGSTTTTIFAVPHRQEPLDLLIFWPDGTQSTHPNLEPNRKYIFVQAETTSEENNDRSPINKPLFKDVSQLIENPPFDNRTDLSRSTGTGISWADIDGDGTDDLLVPSSQGGKLSFYLQKEDHFKKLDSVEALADQTTILAQENAAGDISFLLGQSNPTSSQIQTLVPFIPFSFLKNSGWKHNKYPPPSLTRTGTLSQADLDGDGDLDLFVGGRSIANEQQKPASSTIFINHSGEYQLNEKWSEPFKNLGFVSASALGDIDDDGDPDLILALQNDSIRIFKNLGARFVDATQEYQIDNLKGLWNGIAFGDFNNDGRLDFVATNWGLNRPPPESSLSLTLSHTAFIHQGNTFTPQPLPLEAQLSSAFGVCVADFDGDGFEDIFLAQNASSVPSSFPNDSGRGLVLRGKGDGTFDPLSGDASGICVYEEQAGAALSDFNRDSRIDLAIVRPNHSVKLYQNITAKPGLRIQLNGSKTNKNAIGAIVRIKYVSGWGAAHLITSGSGYWSQNASAIVCPLPSKAELIKIRWPNGQIVEYPLEDTFPSLDCNIDQIKGIHWNIH